jgi:hypothetical protein
MNLLNPLNSGSFSQRFSQLRVRRGFVFGAIILMALIAFEIFNYSTTDYALSDVLGDLKFAGMRWSTILAIAFCGIDFAGIARMFTPESENEDTGSVWYLFGAWLLAATMNAILTWWGVSMAIVNHPVASSTVVSSSTLVKVVPIFVAVMVWLIRILIIGSLSYSSNRLFGTAERRISPPAQRAMDHPLAHSIPAHTLSNANNIPTPIRSAAPAGHRPAAPTPAPVRPATPRPAPKPVARPETAFPRPEPTYHSISMRSGEKSAPVEINEPPRS